MKTFLKAVAGLLLAAVATAALSAAPQAIKEFETLDMDKDGKVSGGEAQADNSLSEAFLQADKNKDGALTRQEYSAWLQAVRDAQRGHNSAGT